MMTPTPSGTEVLTQEQGNPQCVFSHYLSKIRRWEPEAQRLSHSSKTTKITSAECWKVVLQLRSSEPSLLVRVCPLHWTEAVAGAELNVSVLHRRPYTPLVIQTVDLCITSLSMHPCSFLWRQVNPASTAAPRNWEAQAHPLRNSSVSLTDCVTYT